MQAIPPTPAAQSGKRHAITAPVVPLVVKSFSERHPDVRISLLERDSLTIAEGLVENVAEIGMPLVDILPRKE
ncbi:MULTISPECIES: hypothetical protein [Paraburkholderia]|uniref:hypothetical protein n=1 Tax=Paraburkholderia TaxID=1822464 RepID=UPI0022553E24|nr:MULTISPECIES: hypothetical protein [Paraburkholderia]MCX4174611.1 hypothetical protein [Paraburkholderia madseniana]MDQ6462612.1 hypothetical protein [Paraburkholderia madseniana]